LSLEFAQDVECNGDDCGCKGNIINLKLVLEGIFEADAALILNKEVIHVLDDVDDFLEEVNFTIVIIDIYPFLNQNRDSLSEIQILLSLHFKGLESSTSVEELTIIFTLLICIRKHTQKSVDTIMDFVSETIKLSFQHCFSYLVDKFDGDLRDSHKEFLTACKREIEESVIQRILLIKQFISFCFNQLG